MKKKYWIITAISVVVAAILAVTIFLVSNNSRDLKITSVDIYETDTSFFGDWHVNCDIVNNTNETINATLEIYYHYIDYTLQKTVNLTIASNSTKSVSETIVNASGIFRSKDFKLTLKYDGKTISYGHGASGFNALIILPFIPVIVMFVIFCIIAGAHSSGAIMRRINNISTQIQEAEQSGNTPAFEHLRAEKARLEEELRQVQYSICEHCGSKIMVNDIKCRSCGAPPKR